MSKGVHIPSDKQLKGSDKDVIFKNKKKLSWNLKVFNAIVNHIQLQNAKEAVINFAYH